MARAATTINARPAQQIGKPSDLGRWWLAACLLAATCFGLFAPTLRTKPIEEIAVGDRVAGYNPLREQVDEELPEPDSSTWRRVDLEMRKENGLQLWIQLLRPIEWLTENGVESQKTIPLNLPEMGAVGHALVTAVKPCPPIQSGNGTIVTGKFIHQCDGTNVVHLRLDGQSEPTGVTKNHPYWSEDRQDFVEVGSLRAGERVNTEFGLRRVVSIAPYRYTGMLYNLETMEHVYRVDSLGTLVHNDCLTVAKRILKRRPNGAIIGVKPLARAGLPGKLNIPGDPEDAGPYYHHYFHLENGAVRDQNSKGIPVDEWLEQLASRNGISVTQILDEFSFFPYWPAR
jgi:hypothetical protein